MKKACDLINVYKDKECDTNDLMEQSVSENGVDDETLYQDLNDTDASEVSQVLDSHCLERLSCFAHTLQLALKDGLENCSSIRPIIAKCCKLANLCHQSALFRHRFEEAFGQGRSVPTANETRWSSLYKQLSTVMELDQPSLTELLHETDHDNLQFSAKDQASLKELVDILTPWAEITELIQGDQYATIGCVVPSIVALLKCMNEATKCVRFHATLVCDLTEAIGARFPGLLDNLLIPHNSKRLPSRLQKPFSERIYLVAAVLDPNYGFIWLDSDHPGTDADKFTIRQTITEWILAFTRSIDEGRVIANESSDPGSLQPQPKKMKSALFSSYHRSDPVATTSATMPLPDLVRDYVTFIQNIKEKGNAFGQSWDVVKANVQFQRLLPLFENVFCAPCTSAPVERVFSHGGLFVRPHRAKLNDKTLCDLMLAKCN